MVKILLTSVFKPFGIENEFGTKRILPELFESQITFKQEIFSLRSVYNSWGLDLIASNIKAPTKVMHYPSLKRFTKELKKGYDYVGITFVNPTFDKAKIMVQKVREISPNTKVILGGYGAVNPEADKIADYVCHEEGLGFMRKLLNEEEQPNLRLPVVATNTKVMGFEVSKGSVLLLSLGCPNGCDFCSTSHFFDRKRIPFLKNGKELYNQLLLIEKELDVTDFGIIDEDFLLQKNLVTDLAERVSKKEGQPFTFSCFGSVKAISMYEPEELVKLGIDTIWVGVESKNANFEKLKGMDVKKIINSLQDVGINILGSFILGLEHHDEKNLKEDFEDFLSLRPTLSQFLISTPNFATPLYERLKKEGRLLKVPYKNMDGFSLIFKHLNFSQETISKLQMSFFEEEYNRLGPSIFRFIEIQLRGYKNLKNSEDKDLISHVEIYKKKCLSVYPMISTGIRYAPNEKISAWIKNLSLDLYNEFGKPTLFDRLKSMVISSKAYFLWRTKDKEKANNPKTIIKDYSS